MEKEMKELIERLDRMEKLLTGQQKAVLNMLEASELTGYSLSHMYKLTSTGGVPCYKPNGKEIFFNREELEQWLQGGRRATAEELKSIASTYVTLNPRKKL
jgi:excisionase family DNA binding protein